MCLSICIYTGLCEHLREGAALKCKAYNQIFSGNFLDDLESGLANKTGNWDHAVAKLSSQVWWHSPLDQTADYRKVERINYWEVSSHLTHDQPTTPRNEATFSQHFLVILNSEDNHLIIYLLEILTFIRHLQDSSWVNIVVFF